MIKNTEETIELTLEQRKKEAAFTQRLLNLESEIAIASKNLKAIKLDTETYEKEKNYQKELLDTLIPQVEEKKKILSKLDEDILERNSVLSKLNTDIASKTLEQEKKIMELKDREDAVLKAETEQNERWGVINLAKDRITQDQTIFNEKVSKLQEIISTF